MASASSQVAAIVQLASSNGCICQQEKSGLWHILPGDRSATWTLQQTNDNRWLLVIKGQPQINLLPSEVFTFLNRYKMRKS